MQNEVCPSAPRCSILQDTRDSRVSMKPLRSDLVRVGTGQFYTGPAGDTDTKTY